MRGKPRGIEPEVNKNRWLQELTEHENSTQKKSG
jgi:hypothetical protein